MLEKNQELEVIIESVGSEGQGIARVDNFVVFVPLALVGEKVKIHIIKVTKSYAVGKIISIIKQSKDRVVPPCSVYGKCGGCSLQHSSYKNALEIKHQIVKDAIQKIGGFHGVEIAPVISSEYNYGYRNKAAFPLVVNNGVLDVCMYRGLSHDAVCISDCSISEARINKTAAIFKNFANKNYNQKQLSSLRFLVIRIIDEKVLVTIVSDVQVPKTKELFLLLQNELKTNENTLGLYWCKKSKDNNVILEGKLTHLEGIKNISTEIMGVSVEVSPLSFFQVNIDIMKKIYTRVLDNVQNNQIIIDAYSGAGLLSALLSKNAKIVYGIEIVAEATKNANALKELNNINNLFNINGDVAQKLPELLKDINQEFCVVLDPPRKGVDKKVVDSIIGVKPDNILYVSCNPASLARDLKLLCDGGYKISLVEPFDMFPQTSHVEIFVKLSKT